MTIFGIAPKKRDGRRYRAADRDVRCLHCTHDRFKLGEAQLNTAGMSVLGLDWLNDSADVLVCQACGFVLWFAKNVEPVSD